jgi:kinesin family protein 5
LLDQHTKTITDLTYEKDVLDKKKIELDTRLYNLEQEFEDLLDKTIAEEEISAQKNADMEETISTLKVIIFFVYLFVLYSLLTYIIQSKLEAQYASKKEMQEKEIEDLKQEISGKNENLHKLTASLSDLKDANDQLSNALSDQPLQTQNGDLSEREKELERMRKSMAKELADFETMKKVLMRDLQTRCEKVVELEMSLDETREQYNNVLRASNNKAQQKKMAFLERNLEQLTNVQKQVQYYFLHDITLHITELFVIISSSNKTLH